MRPPRPPSVFLGAIGLMFCLHSVAPLQALPGWPLRLAGLGLGLGGLSLSLIGQRQFRRRGTTIETFAEPDMLVSDGLFRHSRNPIYLGLALALLGIALGFGSASPLLVWIGFCLALDRYYIPIEERRMLAAFGADYARYRRRVRRWI
jgi:protein-S-isoprenylcysteine O-methyltransferase Ste14